MPGRSIPRSLKEWFKVGDLVPQPLIQVENVSIVHRLNAVSCEIFKGDRVGIIGASGAGKSTFLQLFNRLIDPEQGQIRLEQTPLNQWPIQQLRRRVVLVLQEPKLLGMTVAEAIAYPLQLQQRPTAEIQATVAQWCDRLHIPTAWLERREYEISVGQRQLITIARALVLEPQILLLDEPTSALDLGIATHVFQVLQDQPDLTWLMVNHQLEWVRESCDRVLWLDQGQLRKDCPSSTLDWNQLEETLQQAASEWDEPKPTESNCSRNG